MAEFSRARSGVPWVRKFVYLYIQEILVLRKSSLRSSVGNSTPSCKLGWNFAFQALAVRFGMATRILRKNKQQSQQSRFFRLNFNVYIDVDNREKARLRDKKQRRPSSLEVRKLWNFYTGSEKMRNASGHRGENSHQRQWNKKREQEHIRHLHCSIKRVTRKFLEVSRCSRAKQRQRNVQKKNCAAPGKVVFSLIKPTDFILAVLVAVSA